MAKVATKEKSGGLVAGMYQAGSSMGLLYNLLADGRPHKEAELRAALPDRKIVLSGRLSRLSREGKGTGRWLFEKLEDGRYRMKLRGGKSAAVKAVNSKPAAKGKAKPAAKAKPAVAPTVTDEDE